MMNKRHTSLRTMLCQRLEYFGPGTFQQQLDEAYKDFVGFCKANKLEHSQPPFKESKVAWFFLKLSCSNYMLLRVVIVTEINRLVICASKKMNAISIYLRSLSGQPTRSLSMQKPGMVALFVHGWQKPCQ